MNPQVQLDVFEQIAEVAHEVNAAYCYSIGDDAVSWNKAPQWQKNSAISGVKFMYYDPTVTPEQSHENWLADKRSAGWVYGPVKDADKKEHPCMLPYDELPDAQKTKDALFQATVKKLLYQRGLLA